MQDPAGSDSGMQGENANGDVREPNGSDNENPIWARASLEDVKGLDFEAPISGSNAADCHDLHDAFKNALPEGVEDSATRVFSMLAAAAGMLFKPDDREAPYGPMMQMADGRRTAIPEDFRGQALEPLTEMARSATHPALRARLSDVCWLLDRKQHALGKAAVDGYLEVLTRVGDGTLSFRSETENPDLSHDACRLLRRALQINWQLGWDRPEAVAARELAIRLRKRAIAEGARGAVLRLSDLDLDFSLSEPIEVAANVEVWLDRQQNDGDPHRDVEWLRVAVRGFRLGNKETDANRCQLRIVDALEAQAERHESAMVAAHWLSRAVAELHGVPGQTERRRQLRHRLIDVQAGVLDEMSVFSHPMDLSEIVETTKGQFEPLGLKEKLFAFAALSSSPDPDKLAQEAAELIQKHPLSAIIGVSLMDGEGKVVHRTQGSDLSGSSDDPAIIQQISQAERIRHEVLVSGSIEPARQVINDQHYVSDDIVRVLFEHSPFVPSNLVGTFARGFARYFQGDFVSAVYILTPLLENSLRYVLKQADFDVSTFDDSTQTQQDRTLSTLFEQMRPELEQIFSSAVTTDIANVFLNKTGPALRNQVAHGLLHDGSPYGAHAIYGCWLIFHLTLIPLFAHRNEIALESE